MELCIHKGYDHLQKEYTSNTELNSHLSSLSVAAGTGSVLH